MGAEMRLDAYLNNFSQEKALLGKGRSMGVAAYRKKIRYDKSQ